MDALPSIPELIGLFVAVALALGFVSYLLYIRGMEAGMSRRRVRRTLVAVWLVVFGLLAALLGLRVLVGTPLVAGSPTEGLVSVAHMTPAKWVLTALAVVLVATGAWWLRRTVQAFETRPPLALVETDPSPDADDKC